MSRDRLGPINYEYLHLYNIGFCMSVSSEIGFRTHTETLCIFVSHSFLDPYTDIKLCRYTGEKLRWVEWPSVSSVNITPSCSSSQLLIKA